jgi:glutaredoxin-like YruB-family protein
MAEKIVKVYTTPTCPWCKKVKQLLSDNGIQYQEMNVAEDKAAREEMANTTHQLSIPTTLIDGEFVIGFNEKALKEKLGIK